jgi:branched-chain amino acid transport system permease protein
MRFTLLFAQLLNGFVLGAMLALISSGLTIILGMLGLVNFAHGAFFALGAYVGYVIYEQSGSFAAAALMGGVVVAGLGIALERGILRHFYRRGHEDHILITFGISIILVELLRAYFGGIRLRIPTPTWGEGILDLGFMLYPKYRVELFVIATLALSGLYILLYWTRIGLVIRAGIENPTMVRMLGIDVPRVFTLVFGIGALAAGFSGVVYAPIISVSPDMGDKVLVEAFVVVVLGGLGSFGGAVVGGLIAGEILSLTSMIDPALSEVMLFAAMGFVLITRPRGLFGKEEFG